jgi:hypothetical protein
MVPEAVCVSMRRNTPIKLPAAAIGNMFNLVRKVIESGNVDSLRTLANTAAGGKTVSDAFEAVAARKADAKQAAMVQAAVDGSKQGLKTLAATRAVDFSLVESLRQTLQWVWTCTPSCRGEERRWTEPGVVVGKGKGMITCRPRC